MSLKLISGTLVLVVLALLVYFLQIDPALARSKCADYAMKLTVQSYPDSFESTGDEFPPYRLKAGGATEAGANYNLFYGFCINKRGLSS